MAKQERLREAKQHGAAWFPFNIYPCTIPKDFPQVALHWQDSMELVFVKKGRGIVQAGLTTYTAQAGDIYVFAPGVLHALRQLPGEAMEYENIIFELELLGGAGDICAEKYLLPLQSGRLALPMRLGPEDWGYNWAVRPRGRRPAPAGSAWPRYLCGPCRRSSGTAPARGGPPTGQTARGRPDCGTASPGTER